MGFLKEDEILDWSEMKPYLDKYKMLGISQFISLYKKYKYNKATSFYWGYETEYMLIRKSENNNYQLLLKSDILVNKFNNNCWKPEYGNWILEKIPEKPFNSNMQNLLQIEEILKNDNTEINKKLNEGEYAITMTCFPMIGGTNFYFPKINEINNFSNSTTIPDNTINPHIRFRTLTKNIRERRKEKVKIEVPIYKDTFTQDDNILMDCMGYGMGCCCLQVTLQSKNIDEAMYLYDQFAILSPILLAISASCPIINENICNTDTRWDIISQSVDDRIKEENISKSRFSSISTFLHRNGQKYNDIEIQINKKIYKKLIDEQVPKNIAKHIAYLFIRDPIIMYKSDVDDINNNINKDKESDYFLNINSSNWNNVRLKPPLSKNDSWKVELRIYDIQRTAFQNSALIIFTIFLARIITYFNLNFYMPISKIDKNFEKALMINGIKESYYIRTSFINDSNDLYRESSINEIINGRQGVMSYIYNYLECTKQSDKLLPGLEKYLHYISELASNFENTNARDIREFVLNHSDYYKDSKVNNTIINDLIDSLFIN